MWTLPAVRSQRHRPINHAMTSRQMSESIIDRYRSRWLISCSRTDDGITHEVRSILTAIHPQVLKRLQKLKPVLLRE